MCGRFDIHTTLEIIAKIFDVDDVACDFVPNYNAAPSQQIPIVVHTGNKNRLILSTWGFLPSWAQEARTAYSMINARAETIDSSRSYKEAFFSTRCLVVADGFYEWQRRGTMKVPSYIRLRSGVPMAFAGLYNAWRPPEGGERCTSTIVTTDANELVSRLHDRMPVILHREDYARWLNPEVHDTVMLKSLLRPFPSGALEAYPVSPRVNSPAFNSPDAIKPAP